MKDLIEMYNNYRTIESLSINEAYCLMNNYDLVAFNTSVITLLDWVRLEYKRDAWIAAGKPAKHKNLRIEKYNWCETLRKIVSEEPTFSRFFMIDGDEIKFSNTLSEADKKEFCRKAAEEMVIVRSD